MSPLEYYSQRPSRAVTCPLDLDITKATRETAFAMIRLRFSHRFKPGICIFIANLPLLLKKSNTSLAYW